MQQFLRADRRTETDIRPLDLFDPDDPLPF
jgi:hypothetical protein